MQKFSIILPVRNGGEYLKQCVASILSQTVPSFNLLLLENGSTDGTKEWIRTISDERVNIYEAEKPLSIEENWGRIVNIPKNEFITLIGHDDLLEPNYLEVMEALIANYPDAGLYQTHFFFINEMGEKIRRCKPMAEIETAPEFLKSFLTNRVDVNGTGYMMRAADFDAVGGMPPYPSLLFADFELWIRLTQKSYKATSAKDCFSFRIHQSTTTTSSDTKMQLAFEKFIFFLKRLEDENPACKDVIQQDGEAFILAYCKGLSHRLLRTPFEKRNQQTVKAFIEKCKGYANMLIPGNHFDPMTVGSIRLAQFIDQTSLGRKLFLSFKKLYSKPIIK